MHEAWAGQSMLPESLSDSGEVQLRILEMSFAEVSEQQDLKGQQE